ncbi:hypothetical protein PIB30_099008 [Stylosanthes scabra]|uniref:Uncharacterized protein n=1 Tax=Stylosanthes scabra TaxID=79078 RepID=A0ABU6WV11_9FABA|nr:hypothetical protein [Stylosanthes scabra]
MAQSNHMINRSIQSTTQGWPTRVNSGNGQHRSAVKVKKSTPFFYLARHKNSSGCYRRCISEDGVRRCINARHIDLNYNESSIQEEEEAARYIRYTEGARSNTDDIDRDVDEEEDYLVEDGNVDDNEDLAGEGGPSTSTNHRMKYDLRTTNSRRNPSRYTPSGWSIKRLEEECQEGLQKCERLCEEELEHT